MTEQEAKEAMKACGWSYLPRKRRKRAYVYVERWWNGGKIERYICSLDALEHLTVEELKAKLM